MGDFSYIGALPAEIRCYRSAALTTGGDGSFVVLPWDTESATPTKIGFAHSNVSSIENITTQVDGTFQLNAAIRIAGGTWDEIRGSVEIDGVAVHAPTVGASSGLLGLLAEPTTLGFSVPLWLTAGQAVRVRVASVGQANVAITVGATNTWLAMRQL